MRLIGKEQAYQTLSEYYHHTSTLQHMALREALDRVPAVDAVPVVRCKNCKYYEEQDETIGTCLLTESGAHIEGYCSWAERKEE